MVLIRIAQENIYRDDVTILRAVAVLMVVLHHFKILFVSGGFVGVDIFFVISGYVITQKIVSEMRLDSFSFAKFYFNRARRLLPSLFAVLLVCTVISLLFFSANSLKEYGKSLSYVALSLGNFHFWQTSGYFDMSSAFKPLLHTWSLGVEEQFYLFWPVILYILFYNRFVFKGLVAIFFSGFLVFIVFSDNAIFRHGMSVESSTIFYMLPFRIFEFSLGALAFYISIDKFNKLFFLLGMIIIIFSGFYVPSITAGTGILLPCLGVFLCLAGGFQLKSSSAVTAVFFWVGSRSYSLYLVHWPVWVYAFYISQKPADYLQKFLCLLFSFLFASILHRFVETKFRYSKNLTSKNLIFSAIFLSLVGFFIFYSNGLQFRISEEKNSIAKYALERKVSIVEDYLPINGRIALLGESHSTHFLNLLRNYFKPYGYQIVNLSGSGCIPIIDTFMVHSANNYKLDKRRSRCIDYSANKIIDISEEYDAVVLAARWSLYTEASGESLEESRSIEYYLVDTASYQSGIFTKKKSKEILSLKSDQWIEFLDNKQTPVLVMGQVPPLGIDLLDCITRPFSQYYGCTPLYDKAFVKQRLAFTNALFSSLDIKYLNMVFLNSFETLCGKSDDYCPIILDDIYLYRDDDHLNMKASGNLVKYYRRGLDRFRALLSSGI